MEKQKIIKAAFNGKWVFVVTLLILITIYRCKESSESEKLNFVFILADDLGWNQVGYHGLNYYETPNIDAIANAGVYFTDAYAAAPVCSPTRASLMTGKSPARLHITDYIPGSPFPYAKLTTPQMAPALPLEEVTIAEKLKEAGYVSAHIGKWHLNKDKNYQPGRPGDPASQGFDVVFTSVKPGDDADPDKDAHHAKEITERSLRFLDEYGDKPFFLYVSHHVVHRPIMENADLIEKYASRPGADAPEHNPIMGAMIETMDTGIGEILQKLDELNLSRKTVVIFYSDNGGLEQLQDQTPLRGGKANLFEGGIRVPLAIRWPGVVEPGRKSSVMVNTEDFFPTIMEIAGVTYDPEILDGVSLVPVLRNNGSLARNTLYWHYPHYHHLGYKPAGAVREGDYKLIEWFEETLRDEPGKVSLFNLKKDISEANDLSADMPDKVNHLLQKLHDWRREVNAQEMTVNPNYDPEKAKLRFAE